MTDFTGGSIMGLRGTFTVISAADDESDPINLETNTFNFYGVTYTGNNQLFASANGLIPFGQADSDYLNRHLSSSPGEPVIAALWADWLKNSGDSTCPIGTPGLLSSPRGEKPSFAELVCRGVCFGPLCADCRLNFRLSRLDGVQFFL